MELGRPSHPSEMMNSKNTEGAKKGNSSGIGWKMEDLFLLFSFDFCRFATSPFLLGKCTTKLRWSDFGRVFLVPRNTWDACLLQAMQRRRLAWIHKKFQGFRVSNSLKFLTQNKKSLLIAVFFYLFEFKT